MGDILVLGGGDFCDRATELGMYRTSVALEAMEMMGYDAITIGERELSMGYSFLEDNLKKSKIPVITTNLYYNGERFGKPYMIFEKQGVKVGIVSALMSLGTRQSDSWEIKDYSEELKKVLPELDKKCDLIVVLAHIGFTKSFDLAEQFPEIDVILAAHGSRQTSEPTHVGNAILTKAGNQGKWLGRLDLELDKKGNITSYKGSLITLGPKLEEDPAMVAFYKAYQDSAAKLPSVQSANKPADAITSQIEESDYKGARWCRSCHTREFNAWLKTPHSSTFGRLKNDDKIDDENCLGCHTTGYGEGGFTSLEETAVLANVQCESCHGKGKEHIESKGTVKTEKVDSETCTACHDKEWDPHFNFETKKALVH